MAHVNVNTPESLSLSRWCHPVIAAHGHSDRRSGKVTPLADTVPREEAYNHARHLCKREGFTKVVQYVILNLKPAYVLH